MTSRDALIADLQAHSDANLERMRAETRQDVPEEVAADAALAKRALEEGGRVQATLRSRRTGQHVKVALACKKRKPGGGYVSRRSLDGRVGVPDADVIFADDPDVEFGDSYLGAFYIGDGEWRSPKKADPARAWAAERLIFWALAGEERLDDPEQGADVFLATLCSARGRKLEDPVSVERVMGPDCFGKRTGSRSAPRQNVLLR